MRQPLPCDRFSTVKPAGNVRSVERLQFVIAVLDRLIFSKLTSIVSAVVYTSADGVENMGLASLGSNTRNDTVAVSVDIALVAMMV